MVITPLSTFDRPIREKDPPRRGWSLPRCPLKGHSDKSRLRRSAHDSRSVKNSHRPASTAAHEGDSEADAVRVDADDRRRHEASSPRWHNRSSVTSSPRRNDDVSPRRPQRLLPLASLHLHRRQDDNRNALEWRSAQRRLNRTSVLPPEDVAQEPHRAAPSTKRAMIGVPASRNACDDRHVIRLFALILCLDHTNNFRL